MLESSLVVPFGKVLNGKVIEKLHKTKKTCKSLRETKITLVFESSSPL